MASKDNPQETIIGETSDTNETQDPIISNTEKQQESINTTDQQQIFIEQGKDDVQQEITDNTSETNVTTKGTRQKLQRKTSASHSKQEITQCHQCDKKANDYMILCNSCHTWIH